MKRWLWTMLLVLPPLGGASASNPNGAIEDPVDRMSYSLGHQIGGDLDRQGAPIDLEALRRGLLDGLSGADPALDAEAMGRLLAGVKRSTLAAQQTERRREAGRHREAGTEFLAANAAREGVVTLPSGLQYMILREGTGRRPGPDDRVTVHYRAHTLDGHEFYNTYAKGAPGIYHVSGVVPGLTEAFQLMREGSRWKLFLSPDLAYGRRGPLAHHAAIFEVDLIAVEPAGKK